MPTVTELMDRAYRRIRCGVGYGQRPVSHNAGCGTMDRADEPDPKGYDPDRTTNTYDQPHPDGKYFNVQVRRR